MIETPKATGSTGVEAPADNPTSDPCVMLVFGASGDLTKRLLVPALYNLECDGLLSDNFALLGTALDPLTTEQFRAKMNDDIKKFHTRNEFDQAKWDKLVARFHYIPSAFGDLDAFQKLKAQVAALDAQHQTRGNVLFYFAVAPRFFGLLCDNLNTSGFKEGPGWKRIIVEKPFGTDLKSALQLNRDVLAHWNEDQIYRVDHYLGKETVQNLLAFRFSNGMFEPLWNSNFIDNIQFNVAEAVDVEGRGGYYDQSGVLKDMMQNHMFQMLAYLCMEPPASFKPDAIRNEKSKLLDAVRVMSREEVLTHTARGQYGPGKKADGSPAVGYRQEPDVSPESRTETFAAVELFIDNWR
jgi:glucose-6-phosphate 1-dehydrogenase